MSDSKKRVAVVGAGLSGLGAIKMLLEEGLEPTCFEKTGHLGGLWCYHDDDTEGVASVMKTTIINTSKELGAISDLPPPAHYPNFMHNSIMYQYILSSAKKFGAEKYIRFHHETISIQKAEDYEETGRWKVMCRNTQTNETVSDVFDCVAICIGHHVYPNIPSFPGQELFRGKIIHSHSLKKAQGFEDMNVVVVGVGNSGMDAAVELSSVAKKVYLSSRRGAWVFPKIGSSGLPLDAVLLSRLTALALKYLPYSWICYISETILNKILNHNLYNLKPKHRIFSQHPTVSDTLPIKLLSGVVVTRSNIKTFTENGVIFEGEEMPLELVNKTDEELEKIINLANDRYKHFGTKKGPILKEAIRTSDKQEKIKLQTQIDGYDAEIYMVRMYFQALKVLKQGNNYTSATGWIR